MLREAIESVLKQEYDDFEHIVVDGGSSDGSVEMLGEYKHLKWISEPDEGQAEAMNKGLGMISGDIFGWLNSDDTYPKGTFESVSRVFSGNPGYSMIYGRCNLVNEEGLSIGSTRMHKFNFNRMIMGFNNINTPAVFVKVPVIREVGGFDVGLTATYDIDMWIRIAREHEVVALQEVYSNLRLHSGSGLVSTRNHLQEIPMLRKKYWNSRTLTDRFFWFPIYMVWDWLFQNLKFRSILRKI